MVVRTYQQELNRLRELAAEFAAAHPALAPMLSGPSQDPDVERLLEGTAFLSGLLRQKLDDDFPEVVHGLMRLVMPHYLRPIPSASVVAFTPQPGLTKSRRVPAGTELKSIPVDGTPCVFRTCYDVQLHPLELTDARLTHQPGALGTLTLDFALRDMPLSSWRADKLRLHLAGDFPQAASLWSLFFLCVDHVVITPTQGGSPLRLAPTDLHPAGTGRDEALFPYPAHGFDGYRVIQELFVLPEKFLFFDITGLERWQDRSEGSRFEVRFFLSRVPDWLPEVKRKSFALFATPVVNLFRHDADPIALDQRKTEYRIHPAGGDEQHHQVHSVEQVTGFSAGTARRREYTPFELFSPQHPDTPRYTLKRKPSAVADTSHVYLSVVYPPRAGPPRAETLSIDLLCTNACLPERLHYGDICQPTRSSPNLCDFGNIRPPTAPLQPPLTDNLLWRFLSHLSLSQSSLASAENLKALLRLYIFEGGRDRAAIAANQRRVDGIKGLDVRVADRLVAGIPLRGQEISLVLDPKHFGSTGDMVLFSFVLDFFLGTYASINSFVHLTLKDAITGETVPWPARLGDRPLL